MVKMTESQLSKVTEKKSMKSKVGSLKISTNLKNL